MTLLRVARGADIDSADFPASHNNEISRRCREQERQHRRELLMAKNAIKAEMAEVARKVMDGPEPVDAEKFASEMAEMHALLEYEAAAPPKHAPPGLGRHARGAAGRDKAVCSPTQSAMDKMKADAVALVDATEAERRREEAVRAGMRPEQREERRRLLRRGLWEQDQRLRGEFDLRKRAVLSE
eukprot:scaffold226890_cov41-Prasinocladus_malaysianus.AAC.4